MIHIYYIHIYHWMNLFHFGFNIPEFAGGMSAAAQPACPSHSTIHSTTVFP
jgi:hypothetical protein